jgi:hypothetical protein
MNLESKLKIGNIEVIEEGRVSNIIIFTSTSGDTMFIVENKSGKVLCSMDADCGQNMGFFTNFKDLTKV